MLRQNQNNTLLFIITYNASYTFLTIYIREIIPPEKNIVLLNVRAYVKTMRKRNTQLANMADIYANPYLTIIEANGWDAGHGLRGIQGVIRPR